MMDSPQVSSTPSPRQSDSETVNYVVDDEPGEVDSAVELLVGWGDDPDDDRD